MSNNSQKEDMLSMDGSEVNVVQTKRRSSRHLLLYIVVTILALGLLILVLGLYFGLTDEEDSYSSTSVAQSESRCKSGQRFNNFSVSTDTDVCSEIGCHVLEKGGSAVDAAIAGLLCISVVTMHSSGIGGGAFWLVYEREKGKAVFFDAREVAPGAATATMYVNNTKDSKMGPMSACVPGEVKGMLEAHKRYGKLEWRELVQPSIDLAKEGFFVTYALEKAIDRAFKSITDPAFRKLLTNEDESVKRQGDIIVNPKLAKTLQDIQKDPDSFYTGKLAKKIADDFQENGGLITKEDLSNYDVKISEDVLKLDLKNDLMFSCPPPSGGTVVTQIFNILQNYNFNSASIADVNSTVLTYHRIIEAFKFAYARRPLLGDPAFVKNVAEVVKKALDVQYNHDLFKKILDNTTHQSPSYYGGSSSVHDEGSTTHLSVLAPNGDAVSVTSSINYYFGGKFRSDKTGIIYNNEMDDFSTPGKINGFGYPPSKNNYIAPGKRPLSSMSPTIFVDKKTGGARLVVGAAGGSRIITGTAWVALHNLLLGLPLDEAVSKPRLHNQLWPPYVVPEILSKYSVQTEVTQGLKDKGHIFKGGALSVVQAVGLEPSSSKVMAISDPRKGGKAWGL